MTQIQFNEPTAREINGGIIEGSIKTRDGFSVRIVAWDAKGPYPIVGLVDMENAEYSKQWTADGKSDRRRNVRTNYDLVIETEGGEA